MIGSSLDAYFDAAAGKLLSAVEVDMSRSNQHELNGVGLLVDLFGHPGSDILRFPTRFLYVTDDLEVTSVEGILTWYDARANHATGTECRLYYPANPVMAMAQEGDFLIVARPSDMRDGVVVLVAPAGSTVAIQLQTLFGLEATERLDIESTLDDRPLDFTARHLLEALGYETAQIQNSRLEEMLRRFGGTFPVTSTFSDFARETALADGREDPDEALLVWMDQEESLYRTLERHLVGISLAEAAGDVDEVLAISMRTFQRRRSRAGHALENHVGRVLDLHCVTYERRARTEGAKKPDFLIPGRVAYLDPSFPDEGLRMLGVKTTCKDRWRQVLTEADRVHRKHLLTLEAPISRAQTDEMFGRQLMLVVPSQLHHLFEPARVDNILSVANFIELVR
ncbi:type II restriction endonuclease [Nocardioides sp. B-3]|uniref:type II restriction endonuclease n=1 Tax=Nocardioides sp. B-3 TaxID=2895565 RepID=UPI002152553A|nr:type II restriction endonuclease [Nocardioides sp. B-3]UUZ60557.1 hypothetical protein LP418_06725 [Nocardioides sp. B-3]